MASFGRLNNPMELTADSDYQHLLGRISEVYTTDRLYACPAVTAHIIETY